MSVKITLDLSDEQAAGLARFADKSGFAEAMAVLYPHVRKELLDEQAATIISSLAVLERALANAGVRVWPWIETSKASETESA